MHLPLTLAAGMVVTAAVSRRDAAAVAALAPGADAEPSLEALLEREDVDLVVVASPSHLHASHARAAILSGRHVVVDKPFAGVLV
jgi:predicted dehydrogenase